jgi:streptomycin 6-kinase
VVLSDNILNLGVSEIAKVTIDATILQGNAVYDSANLFAE